MANVFNLPGVPQLMTGFASMAGGGPVAMVADVISGIFGGSGQRWGIFKDGMSVVTADIVSSFDMKKDFTISNYPVEGGGFESFDKVKLPAMPRVRFTSGMNNSNVSSMLSSVDAIVGDLNLYQVVTPSAVYQSVNLTHYDYRRSSHNGAGMVTIDVYLEEVVVNVQTTASSSSSGSGDGGGAAGAPSGVNASPQGEGAVAQPFGGAVSDGSSLDNYTSTFNAPNSTAPSGFTPVSDGNIQGSVPAYTPPTPQ